MQSFTSKKVARRVELEQYAWRHRQAPTESEARLWEAIRARKLQARLFGEDEGRFGDKSCSAGGWRSR